MRLFLKNIYIYSTKDRDRYLAKDPFFFNKDSYEIEARIVSFPEEAFLAKDKFGKDNFNSLYEQYKKEYDSHFIKGKVYYKLEEKGNVYKWLNQFYDIIDLETFQKENLISKIII